MKELKPGDRVRLMGYGEHGGESCSVEDRVATVEGGLSHSGTHTVRCDGDSWSVRVYPSQIKSRIKKKPRRSVWIPNSVLIEGEINRRGKSDGSVYQFEPIGLLPCTEFREVRAKKGGV